MNIRFLPIIVAALAMAGCTRNTVLIVNPQQNPAFVAVQRISPNCKLSASEGKKYLGATPTLARPNGVDIPQKAKDARVDGCATVEFQLDRSGSPHNLSVVKEYPTGYGFGDALIDTVKVEKFMTVAIPDQWFVFSMAMISSTITTPTPATK